MLSNVLIIDDRIDETTNIREAFLQKGYSPLVVQPEEIDLNFSYVPDIICCDIDLGGTNDTQNFTIICGLLKKIIKFNKLYFFIAWTTNEDLFNNLIEHLSKDQELIKPIQNLLFSKQDFDVNYLEEQLKEIYDNNKGLESLYDWKDIIISSVYKQLYSLQKVAEENNCSIQHILFSLGEKTNGKKNFLKNKILSTCTFLHLLLEDSVDSTIKLKAKTEQNLLFKDIEKPLTSANIPEEELNSLLIISEASPQILDVGDFILFDESLYRKVIKTNIITIKHRKKIQRSIMDKNNINGITLIKQNCIWGIVNITAVCDLSNLKQGVNKFVLACIIEYSDVDKEKYRIKSPSFIVYRFKQDGKNKILVINSKYIFGIDSKCVENCKKIFKIRKQFVDSIRQQVYSYNSRIGTISF